jgi:two-component system sensor histidine kinase KdpD
MGSSWSVRYASAIAVVASATLLVALVRAALGYPPFLLLAGAVCIDAVFLGIGPAICALILATVASDFFFIEPTFAFSLNREVWRLSVLYYFVDIMNIWFS